MRRGKVRSGAHEALRVQRHIAFRQPVRVRIGADEQKEMTDGADRFLPGSPVAPAHRIKIALMALQRLDLRPGQHLDVQLRFDALAADATYGGAS